MKGTVRLHELYERYRHQVQFLNIYIREAHPKDGWWLAEGVSGLILRFTKSKAATDIHDPRSMAERREVASQCEVALQHGIKTYVDDMDDTVNKTYAAWPTRLYLVGLDGRVVYAGGLGPFGFKPAELATAIDTYLEQLELAVDHGRFL